MKHQNKISTFIFSLLLIVSCMPPKVEKDVSSEGSAGSSNAPSSDIQNTSTKVCTLNSYKPVFSDCINDSQNISWQKSESCSGGFPPPASKSGIKCKSPVTPTPTASPTPGGGDDSLGADPLWETHAWHLNNTSQRGEGNEGGTAGADLNVTSVWNDNITGEGIKVLVSDDGVDSGHEDLNLTLSLSKNYLQEGNNDPVHDTNDPAAGHGTGCAGLIAAVAGNNLGSRGVAPKVSLGGYNSLNSPTMQTFIDTAGAPLDIHNYSWGATINSFFLSSTNQKLIDIGVAQGMTRSSLDDYTASLIVGGAEGRGGRGTIYVRALGNAYENLESSCIDLNNADPYQIMVAALNAQDVKAVYSSVGSCLWISGYGSDHSSSRSMPPASQEEENQVVSGKYPGMMTTDISGCEKGYSKSSSTTTFEKGGAGNLTCNYNSLFNGTSSAAPTVSGVIALILQAAKTTNRELNLRDVKHILAKTSVQVDKTFDPPNLYASQLSYINGYDREFGWKTNRAGYNFSHWYGFGKVDAGKAIDMAKSYNAEWNTRGKMSESVLTFPAGDVTIPVDDITGVSKVLTPTTSLTFIESIKVEFSMKVKDFPALSIDLISPSGTVSKLVIAGQNGSGATIINKMEIITNAFYGENPTGENSTGDWKITVVDAIEGEFYTLMVAEYNKLIAAETNAEDKKYYEDALQLLKDLYTEHGDNPSTLGDVNITIYGH